jgi:hypothetical protein
VKNQTKKKTTPAKKNTKLIQKKVKPTVSVIGFNLKNINTWAPAILAFLKKAPLKKTFAK